MVRLAVRARRRATGFTLIELLVVLSIVAVLLTIVVPRLYAQVDHAKETVLAENLRTVRLVLDKFYADKNRYPSSLDELVQEKYIGAVPVDPVAHTTQWQLTRPPPGYAGDVYDIHSTSGALDRGGKPYANW